MSHALFLDLESIPTDKPAHIAEIAKGIKPPASMSKPETIAKWEEESKPAAVVEAVSKTSFNGAYGRVCCIGWAWNDDEPHCLVMGDDMAEDEMMTLAMFLINEGRPEGYERPVIVGHYVADFDLRFLWQRAFVNGVRMPAFWPVDPKPWSKEVKDTMMMWAGAKGTISLDNLCKALGVPGKDDVDGSMVAEMWKNKEYQRIGEYCAGDVERVRSCYRKMQVALGERE